MSLQEIKTIDGKTVLVNVIDSDRKFPLTEWDEPDKHPPTYGVNSSYVAQEFPKAVYTSYTVHIRVNNKAEEDAAIAAGGSLNYYDFPAPIEVEEGNELAALKRQMAAMQELLAKQGETRKALATKKESAPAT